MALKYLRWALEINPDEITYQFLLGSLLYQTGQMEEAVGYLRTAAIRRPWHHGIHYNLGMSLVRLGREEEGKMYLARADSLQEIQQRISRWQQKTRVSPDSVVNWVILADLFVNLGRFDQAIENYKIALTLEPKNFQIKENT